MRASAVLCSVLVLTSCSAYWLPGGMSSQAQALHADWSIFFYTGVFVAVVVYALILAPLIVWRRRDERYPPQFNQNTALEITYTVIPLLMVCGLFYFTYQNESQVDRLAADPALTVDVTGFRWSWTFAYPGTRPAVQITGTPQTPPELVLPVNETIRFRLTSADVNHAFWIPDFLFKRDAIPGVTNYFDLRPTRTGVYGGSCAEFCGLEHALMTFRVRVVSASGFTLWLKNQQLAANARRLAERRSP